MTSAKSETILRVIDANANRASEGLRTLEETARFVLNDRDLQSKFKTLRHDLTAALARLSRKQLLASRDTPGDIGTQTQTAAEERRTNPTDLIAAASSRCQQALRCLEEYGKVIDITFASEVESIRYRAYDCMAKLELRTLVDRPRLEALREAQLYALIDAGDSESEMLDRIRLLAQCGVKIVQLRDSRVDDRTLFHRACVGTEIARELNLLWIINDRADIAVAADADGVHVGQDELPVDHVRSIVGHERLIGLSTHDLAQVRDASQSTADYIGCGPTFPGKTKQFREFPGCAFLRSVVAEFSKPNSMALPAFAIGGITDANIHDVAETGFHRVAVTAALQGDSTERAASTILNALQIGPARDQRL